MYIDDLSLYFDFSAVLVLDVEVEGEFGGVGERTVLVGTLMVLIKFASGPTLSFFMFESSATVLDWIIEYL